MLSTVICRIKKRLITLKFLEKSKSENKTFFNSFLSKQKLRCAYFFLITVKFSDDLNLKGKI